MHDATSRPLASILGSMEFPDYPAAMGVIRDVSKPDYAAELMAQVETAQTQRGAGDLNQLYLAADLWTVEERETTEAREITPSSSDFDEMPITGLDEEYIDEMEMPAEVLSEFQDVLVTDYAGGVGAERAYYRGRAQLAGAHDPSDEPAQHSAACW